ncbi:3D (Asp-Asp-Asp) domain-containing protein [Ornithinibacillus halophilus]|uniref:3D (Asp-Asp-Asp) domain-containing protein n=2 Tax=Ornithinibacillus halophilus TaxID=930117 RepID=A0A1M5IBQ0_9BACI|nr:3D (Asp-Asp-Asp) domain-containing protein [Ornithinibacillus halophilus]
MMKKLLATLITIIIIVSSFGIPISADKLTSNTERVIVTGDHIEKQKLSIYKTYLVQKGETLQEIGEKHDVSEKDIKKWNNLKAELLEEGQKLKLLNSKKKNLEIKTLDAPKTEVKSTKTINKSEQDVKKSNEKIMVKATAYTAKCDGCSGITYTGVDLNTNPNAKVIAIDPTVIPLGTKVHVEGYGYAIAADIGSAIKGKRIDIHVPTKKEAFQWGVREVEVTIIEE